MGIKTLFSEVLKLKSMMKTVFQEESTIKASMRGAKKRPPAPPVRPKRVQDGGVYRTIEM